MHKQYIYKDGRLWYEEPPPCPAPSPEDPWDGCVHWVVEDGGS